MELSGVTLLLADFEGNLKGNQKDTKWKLKGNRKIQGVPRETRPSTLSRVCALSFATLSELCVLEEPNMERAWPHLQIVYEFFLRFARSSAASLGKMVAQQDMFQLNAPWFERPKPFVSFFAFEHQALSWEGV